ncbi:AraC family transcriptional regulator [Rhodococcus artemisiae]|uniref:Helix-turn-helix domain-containing protein n=1 Tax=Rhodococcus artemisiae TaxID=714159 RepID=A0ABU7LFH4_9NOCA|nr:helix-turn-helix domain-containing protein [Rhodococcus artemisiae]MEE2059682.1 helix-turn-helix domain-containing protein [Rhodococcus artemisiae]
MSVGSAIRVTAQPSPALRGYVVSYDGFEQHGFPPGIHRGAPGRYLTLVVSLSEPIQVVPVEGCTVRDGRFDALVGGLTSKAVAIGHDGRQHGVKVSLTPMGARAVYGMPAAALANDVVDLGRILGGLGRELTERSREARSWRERFAAVDDVLLAAVRGHDTSPAARAPIRPEVREAWRRLSSSRGAVQIGSLAAELGWSRRHLTRQFHSEIGLTPKEAARVLRFEHAYVLATAGTPPAWSTIASATGFADQAHLVRDWRDFTGLTPTAWRGSELLAH